MSRLCTLHILCCLIYGDEKLVGKCDSKTFSLIFSISVILSVCKHSIELCFVTPPAWADIWDQEALSHGPADSLCPSGSDVEPEVTQDVNLKIVELTSVEPKERGSCPG